MNNKYWISLYKKLLMYRPIILKENVTRIWAKVWVLSNRTFVHVFQSWTAGYFTCRGTLAVQKSRLQLLENCRFIWCRKNATCFQYAFLVAVEKNPEQVLILELALDETEDEIEVIIVLVMKIAEPGWSSRVESWSISTKNTFVEIFPANHIYFLRNEYRNEMTFKKYRKVVLLAWFENWHVRFHSVDVDRILAIDQWSPETTVKQSKIAYSDCELGLSAVQTIRTGKYLEFCHGSRI